MISAPLLKPFPELTKDPIKSFEEIFKASYSHGLESIYALENVDLKSIRRIAPPSHSIQSKPQLKQVVSFQEDLGEQLEFDFGDAYRSWMKSFLLIEPIQFLDLSSRVENILIMHNKNTLQDLLPLDKPHYLQMKGMGQGHIDEIQQKLQKYLAGQPLYMCRTINLMALLRSLIASLDRRKNAIYLEAYQLAKFISLRPAESVEVRYFSSEKRQDYFRQAYADYRTEDKHRLLDASLRSIVDVFITPWICSRNGLATQTEITERFQKISEDPKVAPNISKFISDVYFDGQFLLERFLISVEQGLYATSPSFSQAYRLIVQKTHSYFYKSCVTYSMHKLIKLIEREFALEWMGFEKGFVEKVLRYSPLFRVFKNDEHTLIIRLA